MSNELMRVSDIPAPTVSGTVKISLAEMDKLRSDYILAVKLAQDLEAKQSMIKIVYSESSVGHRSIEDRLWDPSYPGNEKIVSRIESFESFTDRIEYMNMEGVLKRLRLEAQKNVQEEVDALTQSKSSALVNMIAAEGALEDYKSEVSKLKTKLRKDLRDEVTRLDKQYKDDHKKIIEVRKENKLLTEKNKDLSWESERVLRVSRELAREMADNSIRGIWNRLFYKAY